MLTKLKLHNFRSYLDTELSFQRRHLLIGRNNSGKTNLACAIRFLGSAASGDLATAVRTIPGGVLEMQNWNLNSEEIGLSCTSELEWDREPCQFTYTLILSIPDPQGTGKPIAINLRIIKEELHVDASGFDDVALLHSDGHEATMLHEENHLDGAGSRTAKTPAPTDATMLSKLYELQSNRRAILFRNFMSTWSYYALSPEAMRSGWRTQTTPLVPLDPRGEQLASALFHLKNWDEMRYRRVIDHVRVVEPAIEAINFIAPASDQVAMPFVVLRNKAAASWAGLSDGTLRYLAMAYLAESGNFWGGDNDSARLNVIEEPENGIYPGQLRELHDMFEECAPHGQFIFTTHSPYFIDLFDASRDAVTILKRMEDRTVAAGAPPVAPEEQSPDRLTLAEKYAAELID